HRLTGRSVEGRAMAAGERHAPRPEPRPHPITAHGDTRIDEWYWLRDRDDPAVTGHLEAENRYTEALTERTRSLQETVYAEIVARIKETDLSVPVRHDGWWYYSRTVEGLQYPIHCRRPAPAEAPPIEQRPTDAEAIEGAETVLLDENAAAEGHDFLAVGNFSVSPDGHILAYGLDTNGSEKYVLRFRDIESGRDLPDVVADTYYGLAWADDNATVFYTRPDESMRPYQLWRHRLGTDPSDDVCVITEDDERFFLHVHRSKDGAFLLCTLASQITTEVRVLPSTDPLGTWQLVAARRQGIEYSVDHQGDRFLIVTNDGARNFRLVEAPQAAPGPESWTDVVPYDDTVKLDDVEVFSGHIVLHERAEGLQRMRVLDGSGGLGTVELPETVASVRGGRNPQYEDHVMRFGYTSLVTPESVFDYDLRTGQRRLLKQQPVLGGYDPTRYVT